MVSRAVAGVQHRYIDGVGGILGGSLTRVAYGCDVRVAVNHLHGVVQSLPLGN